MPCWIIGAATMKMISSTSITSTSGTTLISASEVDTRAPRARLPRPEFPVGIGWTLGTFLRFCLREVPFGDVQELEREIIHLRCEVLHPAGVVIVEIQRRHRGEQAGGGRDQRLGDARRDDAEAGRALRAD